MTFSFSEFSESNYGANVTHEENKSNFLWLISADKIFSSELDKFKDYAPISNLKFHLKRTCVFEESKLAENSICAKDISVYMPSGTHCAMLIGRMSKSVILKKIIIKKVQMINKELLVRETKEFGNCVITSFEEYNEGVVFSFRCQSLSNTYQDIGKKGEKTGQAAVQLNLTKWETKES
ncbi:MAG: hypothetical protein IJA14_02420 [Alphaproteobacteria bacterium]|nr:hypothetical protein [Alphaproteobacteria bacterium]